jgi:hypothetical protein
MQITTINEAVVVSLPKTQNREGRVLGRDKAHILRREEYFHHFAPPQLISQLFEFSIPAHHTIPDHQATICAT